MNAVPPRPANHAGQCSFWASHFLRAVVLRRQKFSLKFFPFEDDKLYQQALKKEPIYKKWLPKRYELSSF